ncbi:MAG: precorrin-8X methylmutase [Rhodospirillaceae bacterium]|nr:precorrin-8X methylmutase [Rhodospirillaceae bacterium]
MFDYIRDPAEIHKRSFETVRAETDVSGLSADEAAVAVRLVHACGMPDIVEDLVFSGAPAGAGRTALIEGAAIYTDVEMVRHGIIRARLPADNPVLCTLHESGVKERAADERTTRSAAAVDLWREGLKGSVVAIGNAPTALFRLLEIIYDGAAPPAMIAAFPVGFVGAAESKQALIDFAAAKAIPFIALKGRLGGSALAAACVNALGKREGG